MSTLRNEENVYEFTRTQFTQTSTNGDIYAFDYHSKSTQTCPLYEDELLVEALGVHAADETIPECTEEVAERELVVDVVEAECKSTQTDFSQPASEGGKKRRRSVNNHSVASQTREKLVRKSDSESSSEQSSSSEEAPRKKRVLINCRRGIRRSRFLRSAAQTIQWASLGPQSIVSGSDESSDENHRNN